MWSLARVMNYIRIKSVRDADDANDMQMIVKKTFEMNNRTLASTWCDVWLYAHICT